MTTSGPDRRIAILSCSPIAIDPRVQRYVHALVADGWQVTTVGFGEAGDGKSWRHRAVPEIPYETNLIPRLMRIGGLLASRVIPQAALWTWHRQAQHRALLQTIGELSIDLVIACDYTSLPAGTALAVANGAALIYDSHELALREKEEDLLWRVLYPPYVRAIEQAGLSQAAAAMTVSEGIAEEMAREYRLAEHPTVIRNVPVYQQMSFRPPGERVVVHHNGVLVRGRGLELLIASVRFWQPRFSLRLRGPIAPDYRAALQHLIDQHSVADRVAILPPLPPEKLVRDASESDIGISMLENLSRQNQLALPNKLFEFVMAGLAIVVSDLPEMRRVVGEHGVGIAVSEMTDRGIADAINGLTADRISLFKRAALAAARNLCWEAEEERFLALCRAALAQPRMSARISATRSAARPSP